MRKVLISLFLTIYILISVLVTTCLLNYNDYQVSVIDNASLIIVNKNNELSDFKNGSLLIVTKDKNNINPSDKVLYYDTYSRDMKVKVGEITKSEKITQTEFTYTLDNGNIISSEFIIGNTEDIRAYSFIGYLLSIFESKYGYLLLFVLPILLIFIYEIYTFILELIPGRKSKKRGKMNEKTSR